MNYDELLQPAEPSRRLVYKSVNGVELSLFLFDPPTARPGDKRPAIVWIHGGGWTGGTPDAFFPHARYYTTRGAVGVSVQYRLLREGGPTAEQSVQDCRSAIRYLRKHAAELGIDPSRIAVLGDSAGGHLAGCLATSTGSDDPADDTRISPVPDAAVLYNPITDLTEGQWWYAVSGPLPKQTPPPAPTPELRERARALSPLAHVAPGQPPMLVLHGRLDKVVLPAQSERFAHAARAAGNRCDLELIPDARHAFVCTRYTAPPATVVDAIVAGDRFLTGVGILSGDPDLHP